MTQLHTEPPMLVTVEEAARRLSIGRTATYMLVLRGELQSVKIGRTRRVVVSSLNDYITTLLNHETDHAPPTAAGTARQETPDGWQTRQQRGQRHQTQ